MDSLGRLQASYNPAVRRVTNDALQVRHRKTIQQARITQDIVA